MTELQPTREEAVAALAEAGMRESQVRVADSRLRWMLLALLAVYGGVAILMSLSPHKGTTLTAVGLLVLPVAALAFIVLVAFRIRAYSRRGIRTYFATVIAFNLWNGFVSAASIATRFWALGEPSYHFGISAAVGLVPLLIGVWLLSRKRLR